MKPNVELRIDELILRGAPHAQRWRIAAAIEQELTRLLREQGLPEALAEGGALSQIKLDTLQMADGLKPQVLGAQIAQRVYNDLVGHPVDHQPELLRA